MKATFNVLLLSLASWATVSAQTYSVSQMAADLRRVLKPSDNMGRYSKRHIGDPAKIKLWTPEKYKRLYEGITAGYQYFYGNIGFDLKTFARLVLCEGGQESTGDYNLGVKPIDLADMTSHGFIQVTPGTVVKEYVSWGMPVGNLIDPKTVQQADLSDPGINVALWAWYTYNALGLGMSLKEYGNPQWNSQPSKITKDFGNAQYAWLGGPRNSRYENENEQKRPENELLDYYHRNLDYWVGAGFGTKEQFDQLVDTPVFPNGVKLKLVRPVPGQNNYKLDNTGSVTVADTPSSNSPVKTEQAPAEAVPEQPTSKNTVAVTTSDGPSTKSSTGAPSTVIPSNNERRVAVDSKLPPLAFDKAPVVGTIGNGIIVKCTRRSQRK